LVPFRVAEDKFAWLRDDEFARQALAGINPVNIERLQVTRRRHAQTRRGQ
jgi:lipoxygenase